MTGISGCSIDFKPSFFFEKYFFDCSKRVDLLAYLFFDYLKTQTKRYNHNYDIMYIADGS